jgi:hypothetical protein
MNYMPIRKTCQTSYAGSFSVAVGGRVSVGVGELVGVGEGDAAALASSGVAVAIPIVPAGMEAV